MTLENIDFLPAKSTLQAGVIYRLEIFPHDLRHLGRLVLFLVERALRRYRVRQLMRELDAEQLDQLGLSADDEVADAFKWFWET
jgi:hypothetical protein